MDHQTAPSPVTTSDSGIESLLPEFAKKSLEWEKKQWADGSVLENDFYLAPENTSDAAPGTLLKVEQHTNTSRFAVPPATALSRIVYQSKTLNGSLVPVSAYILWPYSARSSPDGYQVVAWSHGTSGMSADCAPSHMVNLWQHYHAPYSLAQQGYVVVATDYAGLGVARTASGEPIIHEYLASPSQANDCFYSVQAAQKAFPELGKSFVVIGHSQGGGSAWAAAQRQAHEPVEGYLGAVAMSPVTDILAQTDPVLSILVLGMTTGNARYFPELKPSDILTPEGLQRADIANSLGCTPTLLGLLSGVQLLQSNWTSNPWVQKYQALVKNGGKQIAGPLLVLHGEGDKMLNVNVTTAAVEQTLHDFPDAQLEYIRLPKLDHVPTITASQVIWMDWIADRFAGKPLEARGIKPNLKTAMPVAEYQPELNWYLALATEPYQAP